MKPRKLPLLLVPVLAALGGWLLWRNLSGNGREAAGTISGNGVVEATETEVSTKVAGRLLEVKVKEGDWVDAGQLLAVMDGGDLEGQARQARGNLAAAEAALAELKAGTREEDLRRLRAQLDASDKAAGQARARLELLKEGARRERIGQLKAGLNQAEVSLGDAETELARARKLVEQGAIPTRDLDQARTRRDLAVTQVEAARQLLAEAEAGARPQELAEAEAALQAARAQVEAARAALDLGLAGPRRETVQAAAARVEQARGAMATAEYLLGETRIAAPGAGVVTLRSAEPGEMITPGQPIVRLADLRDVWLRVYVAEPKVGLVKLGQPAEVTTDTHPGKSYAGRVVEIADKPEFTPKNVQTKEERVKLVFGVKIGLENPEQELKPGMPADAIIRVSE